MGEVFLGEGLRGRPQPVVGEGEVKRDAGKLSQDGGRIQDRVGLSEEIEVEEGEAVAVKQDMIGLEIPMGRSRWDLFEAFDYGSDDRLDLHPEMRTGPPEKCPRLLQLRDLVFGGVAPRRGHIILIQARQGPGPLLLARLVL